MIWVYSANIPTGIADFDLPELQYYLGKDDSAVIHANGQMVYGDSHAAVDAEQSNAVKAALGLPPTATTEQIIATLLKEYGYSYTPLKDSGKKSDEVGGGYSDADILVETAVRFAQDFDTQICNTLTTILIAAIEGEGNVSKGYLVTDKGANSLSQKQTHVWIVRIDGTELDAARGLKPSDKDFPVEKPKVEKNPANTLQDRFQQAGEVGVGVGLGVVAYRRRKRLQDLIHRVRDQYVEKTYLDNDSPDASSIKDAVAAINYFQFAPPDGKFTRDAIGALPLADNPRDALLFLLQTTPLSDEDWLSGIRSAVIARAQLPQQERWAIIFWLGKLEQDAPALRETLAGIPKEGRRKEPGRMRNFLERRKEKRLEKTYFAANESQEENLRQSLFALRSVIQSQNPQRAEDVFVSYDSPQEELKRVLKAVPEGFSEEVWDQARRSSQSVIAVDPGTINVWLHLLQRDWHDLSVSSIAR